MQRRNQIISSLIAIAITTSVANNNIYAKGEEINSGLALSNQNNSNVSSEENLELNKSQVTTSGAVSVKPVINDESTENNGDKIVKIEDIKLTLDDYLKNRNSQQKIQTSNRSRIMMSTSLIPEQIKNEAIKTRIKDGIQNYSTAIDIKDLVSLDDIQTNSSKILDLYFDVLYENPDIFYCDLTHVGFGNCSYNPDTRQLRSCDIKVNYIYTADNINNMKAELNAEISNINSKYLSQCSTDLEKEYAIHDYLTQNCTYDLDNYQHNTVPNISHTAYGAIVNKIAVCDGYSRAAMLLLNKYTNITAGIVTGTLSSGGHAWNYVNIGGKYYQTDLTWDDPTPETNRITYKNFNCSDSVMTNIHPSTSTSIIPSNCTDTTYDNLFRIISGNTVTGKEVTRNKDKLYYLNGNDLYSCDLDGQNKALFKAGIAVNNKGRNLVSHNNDIYYLCETKLKKINIENKEVEDFKDLGSEFNFQYGSYSAQFYIKDDKMTVKFGQSQTGGTLQYSTKEYELPSAPVVIVNKSDLQGLYDGNKNKTKGNYTDASWSRFETALSNANSILAKTDATQSEVDTAKTNLQSAISGLAENAPVVTVNKNDLQGLYDGNKNKTKGNYTDVSWSGFTTALSNANLILAKTDTTQSEVDTAKANLETAINGLAENAPVVTVNKSDLQGLYNLNKDKVKGNYTDASWSGFTTALSNANSILTKTNATQAEVDIAKANLQTAINGLIISSTASSSSSSSHGGGSSHSDLKNNSSESTENNIVITNGSEKVTTSEINTSNSANSAIVSTVEDVAKKVTVINKDNKEVKIEKIYQADGNNFKGNIANLSSDGKKYIYVDCEKTTDNTNNVSTIKIDISNLNNKENNVYKFDKLTNKLILVSNVQSENIQNNVIEMQVQSGAQYMVSDTQMESLKNNDWNKINEKWVYVKNGDVATGWIKASDNKWYNLSSNGYMNTGWLKDTDANWYYLKEDGSMKTGWLKDANGKWYYLKSNGSMAADTVIDGYYVDKNGAWV